jgi:nitrate reductase (NAD(P)H)
MILRTQRMKAEGKDILKPVFSDVVIDAATGNATERPTEEGAEVVLTKSCVNRKITIDELEAQDKEKPWVRLSSNCRMHRVEESQVVCGQW